ncbi:MAG: formylglycine-generating enzyme family protein [Treponema sp.]|jgi:formylglycine-generating enzyme required for sulfatase activity|nr:formylglycine-generating enzyme family protein [Treponema sp.]
MKTKSTIFTPPVKLPVAIIGAFVISTALTLTGCPDGSDNGGGGTDTTAPVLSAGSVSAYVTTAGTTATVNFTSDEAGTYYVVVYASATDAPASGAALKTAYDGGVTGSTVAIASAAATASANTANITGLTTGTAYKAHVTVKDAAGNYSTVWSSEAFTPITADTTAPVLSAQSVSAYVTTAGTTATVNFTSDEAGTYYVVVYASATDAPASGAALKTAYDGGVTGSTIAIASAAATASANTVNITGLTTGTAYKAHVTVKDAAGNYSTVWSSAAFTPTQYTFTTPEQYRSMASIGAITSLAGTGSSGVFIAGRTVTLSAFKIARYETTYELWYEVKTWATSNGYTFTNAGREGHDGTNGAQPTSAKTEPVTYVSWRDAVVWCNAYSEMSGKTPAYYSDSNYSTVIKSLSGDTVYMKSDATGYRLPTEAEWEAAARGGDPTDHATEWAYTYAGADTLPADTTAVAWYSSNSGSATHPVGTGLTGGLNGNGSNSAGLFDMSGNVWEWCWDWYNSSVTSNDEAFTSNSVVVNPTGAGSGTSRVNRGGSWNFLADYCTVSYRGDVAPVNTLYNLGFRVVCAP